MPCINSGYEAEVRTRLEETNSKLEAALCSCVSFARDRGIFSDMANHAISHCSFDLYKWAKMHDSRDLDRLINTFEDSNQVGQFSGNESQLIIEALLHLKKYKDSKTDV